MLFKALAAFQGLGALLLGVLFDDRGRTLMVEGLFIIKITLLRPRSYDAFLIGALFNQDKTF